jgi:NADH-quinone oxidoreductase subunit M
MYQRVFYGQINHPVNQSLSDMDARERVSMWPLAIAALVMGVAPNLWLHSIDPSVAYALTLFNNGFRAAAPAASQITHALIQVIGR